MDWKEYEAITKYIYETLGRANGVEIEGFGNKCKVKGKSNVMHQIDVLASHSDGIHSYKTAIECKYWDKSIDKDIIMKVAAIVEDANLNKGVIVSKLGFTPDATTWAQYKNIGLVELREMQETDWEGRPRIIAIKSEGRRPQIIRMVLHPTDPTIALEPVEASPLETFITSASGEETKLTELLTSFYKELHTQQPWQTYSLTYLLSNAMITYSNLNLSHHIKAISLQGVLTVIAGPRFHLVDQIWLIMKNIFEGTTHTISRQGVIRKDEPS